jgi:hypothetical protein
LILFLPDQAVFFNCMTAGGKRQTADVMVQSELDAEQFPEQ